MVLGLLAQGMKPFLAAAAGFGPGLLAGDLSDCLPAVFGRPQAERFSQSEGMALLPRSAPVMIAEA